jgi:hypothetical protein
MLWKAYFSVVSRSPKGVHAAALRYASVSKETEYRGKRDLI